MTTAMILAAGRGERFKPFTDTCPKALCLINNIPLIEHHILNLAKAGLQRIVINHAHLGGKIRQYLKKGERFGVDICYSPEPPGGLETGGGIVNALPLLGTEPFITVNADIFTDYDFSGLHIPSTSLGHLVLVTRPHYSPCGDFDLSNTHQLLNQPRYTFSGIAIYRPAFFLDQKPGRYGVTPLLRQYADKSQLTGELYHGQWFDIGSQERLELAQQTWNMP